MAVCAATALILLLSLTVLYTNLAPRSSQILVGELRITSENMALEDHVADTSTGI